MAELQVLNGPLQWKTYKLSGPRFLLGRKETCHLVLKDGWVSREHAVLVEGGPGEFLVQDLGSENGISVNGKNVRDAKLKHGDILRVGRTEMRLFHPTGDESGTGLDDLARRSTQAGLPEPLDVDMLDMTIHEPGGAKKPKPDLRERVRRLEKLFHQKEEDNSRLAAENAVLKRALAKGGLIDPSTGTVDLQRLTTPGPREAMPREILPLIGNAASRITWPLVGGGSLTPTTGRDRTVGAHRLGIVGLGRAGVRIAHQFAALGWNSVAALAHDTAVLDEFEGASFPLPSGLDDVRLVGSALEDHQPELAGFLSDTLGTDRTLRLLIAGLGGVTGVGSIPVVLEQLALLDPDAGCGVVLSTPAPGQVANGRSEAVAAGFDTVRRLQAAGKLRPFLVIDEARLSAFAGTDDQDAQNATIAGAIDTLLRLPVMPSIGGTLDGDAARATLADEGMSSLGLAACTETDAATIAATVRHALTDGWLCGSMAPSRGRVAMILAMIGSEALVGDVSVVSRLESAVGGVAELLPQASITAGMHEDRGRGIRIVVWVGGLPFPENLVP